MNKLTVTRYHDISCGHRVHGHEGKCVGLHGHNYRIHFECEADSRGLDNLGRVIDFGVIKERLCMWLEEKWDHKMLLWNLDPAVAIFNFVPPPRGPLDAVREAIQQVRDSIVVVGFNPTAEQMAEYLLRLIAPQQLEGTGVRVVSVRIEETRKCSATASL